MVVKHAVGRTSNGKAFQTVKMPYGELRIMDRSVYNRALAAAGRKFKEVVKQGKWDGDRWDD